MRAFNPGQPPEGQDVSPDELTPPAPVPAAVTTDNAAAQNAANFVVNLLPATLGGEQRENWLRFIHAGVVLGYVYGKRLIDNKIAK